jgi:hypothetical protein
MPQEPAAAPRAAAKALWVAAQRFKRTLFRGLDYLPPGEVSFADFGRAVLAADEASHPRSSQQRDWIAEEFVARRVVSKKSQLEVETNFRSAAVAELDLQALVDSDWVAYDFANRNRKLLNIPREVPFRVYPRLDVQKKTYHRDGEKTVREVLFKVAWTEVESSRAGAGLPSHRRVTAGTTLAVDWESKKVRALLTSERSRTRRQERDRFLAYLRAAELLRVGDQALGPDGRPLVSLPRADLDGGALRTRGTACMLHVAQEV